MMKGLGHLIRTMFGGRKPAPALPSHMVGTVECDQVKAPIASDNVLRRAMGAAAGEAAAAEEASRRIYRHEEPVTEVSSLPTLFLHGKPAGQDVVDLQLSMELPSAQVVEEEPSLGATDLLAPTSYVELDGPVAPAAAVLLAHHVDAVEGREPSLDHAVLETSVVDESAEEHKPDDVMAEMDSPQDESSEGSVSEVSVADATGDDEVFGEPETESAIAVTAVGATPELEPLELEQDDVVSIVARNAHGEAPVALVVEPEILSVEMEPVYPDVSAQSLAVVYEGAPTADVNAAPAVETVAGLMAAEDASLLDEPEAPLEVMDDTVNTPGENMPEAVQVQVQSLDDVPVEDLQVETAQAEDGALDGSAGDLAAEAPVVDVPVMGASAGDTLDERAPAESLASLADTMDDVVTRVGARAAARKPAKKAPAKKTGEPSTKRKKAGKSRPDDAVWLTDALIWSQCGSWREFWLPPTDANSSQRIEEFRAHAAAGSLTVWAKADDSEEWTVVAASHWKKAGFDPLAFLAGRENAFSQAPAPKSRSKKADTAPPKEPVKYHSLMVSKAEVEILFGAAEEGSTVAVA